jgi:formylglycine-generating enzyme required for sulfatase activity
VLYEKKFNIFENRKRFEKMKKLALLILGVLVGIVLTFTIPTASAHNEDVLLLKIRQLEKRISGFEGKISELERKKAEVCDTEYLKGLNGVLRENKIKFIYMNKDGTISGYAEARAEIFCELHPRIALKEGKCEKECIRCKNHLERNEECKSCIPEDWSNGLWKACWNEEGKYVDFTVRGWEELGSAEQSRLAGEYQTWYAKRDNGGVKEKKFREGGTEIEMVLIPPGKYWRGSGESEVGRGSDEVRDKVLISKGYWCGKYEVTQGQWKGVMGSEPSNFKGSSTLPVERVSWEESKKFCEKVGMKLLSEGQWEYACRGGTTTPFSFGENINTGEVNYDGDHPYKNGEKGTDRQKTMEVGSFAGNGWGLYEMHGNVWEWCEDWYAEKYPSGEVKDPVNTTTASNRVYRGGSWNSSARDGRSSFRDWLSADGRFSLLGFRVSRSCP